MDNRRLERTRLRSIGRYILRALEQRKRTIAISRVVFLDVLNIDDTKYRMLSEAYLREVQGNVN